MKEMQLFEVGLKSGYGGLGYWTKTYVAAKDDLDARATVMRWVERDYQDLEEKGFTEEDIEEMTKELASLQVARIHHLGNVILG